MIVETTHGLTKDQLVKHFMKHLSRNSFFKVVEKESLFKAVKELECDHSNCPNCEDKQSDEPSICYADRD